MKKTLLFILTMMAGMTVHAEDYPYLTFELTDGTKTSVSVSSLPLTINGTTLTAGTESFTLTNLSKMYFSADDQSTAGISEIMATDLNEATAVYDLQGRKVSKDQMRSGIYVIKTKQGTFKVNVK